MKFIPKITTTKPVAGAKIMGNFKIPKRFAKHLRTWSHFPRSSLGTAIPGTSGSRRNSKRNYVEKRLYGDDNDYAEEEEEFEEEFDGLGWGEAYVLVSHTSPGCNTNAGYGERRANKSGWEYGSRRMVF